MAVHWESPIPRAILLRVPEQAVTEMLADRDAAYGGPLLYQMNLSGEDKRLLQVELLRR